jgi:bacillopeptidase F (M6 metalloprotease family)
MRRTDKEIIEAMTFIKEQHNGELPYTFGTFECAKMMAKYLKQQLVNENVVVPKVKSCDVCGSKNTITVSHKGENCDWCNPL